MVKNKKLLSILLLFLVSLTAVAATVASNVSVTTDVVDGSHGTTVNGILTFTNNGTTNHTMDIVASSTNTNITFGNIAQTTVTNNSTSTAEYTLLISQFTPAGTYSYTIDYSETTDTNSATFQIEVLSDNTITETIDNDEITTRSSTQEFVLSLNNIGNTQGSITNISFPTLTLNWDETINLTATTLPSSSISLSSNDIQNATATYTTNDSSEYGDYSGILKYNDENGALVEKTITMSVYEDSYNSELEITANFEDITNDDDDTYPGDTVRIEDIEITNEYTDNDDDSVNDIELEYRVYFVIDGDEIIDGTYSETFDLEENDDSELNDIDFQIPFDAEEGDYIIELILIGEVESDGSDDGDEISNRLYLEFNVEKESRHMIPKDLIADSYCPGETAELNIELANIGKDDLDEDDDMMIRVKIPSFDYDQWHNYIEDIDAGDSEIIVINVDIPSNVGTGNQEIKLYSRHDGNSNSNKDGSYLSQILTLSSTCAGTASSSTTALAGQSSEEGTQGMNTKYTLTVTNNGDFAVTYDIEVVGVDAWGAAVVSPEIISVPAGGTSTFSVYLQPGNNAQSTNNAVVNLKSGGEIVSSKTLTLTISGMSISNLTDSLFGNTSLQLGNTSLTTIISLLVVLGTASGAIWLVHGEQIRSSQKKKRKKSKKRRK